MCALQFYEGVHVQNETYPAIAQDGGTCDSRVLSKGIAKALDYDLLLSEKTVHQDGAIRAVRFDDDQGALRRIGRLKLQIELLVELEQWKWTEAAK